MPWKVFGKCVHKLKADGSMGKLVACHESVAKAQAQMRALYANVPEGKDLDPAALEAAELVAEQKCMDESYYWRPYAGATKMSDAVAQMEADDQAWTLRRVSSMFQDIVGNIMSSEDVADKPAAITAAAGELKKMLSDPPEQLKSLDDDESWIGHLVSRIKSFLSSKPATPKDPSLDLITDGSLLVFKGLDDEYRWFGMVSNNYRDRDTRRNPKGEIFTEESHKEFVTYLDEHPQEAPVFRVWHVPGADRKSRADWWDYTDGFLLMSGSLTPEEAAGFKEGESVAMSHGYFALDRDSAQGWITKYRSFEVSDLPPAVAANAFTALDVLKKEVLMAGFTKEKREYLVKRLGEDRVAELEAKPAEMKSLLDALGVESKDAAPPPAAPAEIFDRLGKVELAIQALADFKAVQDGQWKTVTDSVADVTKKLADLAGDVPAGSRGHKASEDGPDPAQLLAALQNQTQLGPFQDPMAPHFEALFGKSLAGQVPGSPKPPAGVSA